jgi:dipeptidyl aminopeptidase/acylaminoacyl peptidase
MDKGRIGIYGVSRGAVHTVRLLVIHPRFKVAVPDKRHRLYAAGTAIS